jgi:hypothetical protein
MTVSHLNCVRALVPIWQMTKICAQTYAVNGHSLLAPLDEHLLKSTLSAPYSLLAYCNRDGPLLLLASHSTVRLDTAVLSSACPGSALHALLQQPLASARSRMFCRAIAGPGITQHCPV